MTTRKKAPKIIEIPRGRLQKRNGAFVAMYCREVRPYLNYDRPIECARDQAFPYILMQLRWDGAFGFPGGKVDPGETLIEACVREADEEINAQIPPSELELICSHMEEGGDFAAHLFAREVTVDGLHEAIRRSWTAKDADAEACGVIAPRISMHGGEEGKGFARFARRTPMSFSARHELVMVLERLKLLDEANIKTLRRQVFRK